MDPPRRKRRWHFHKATWKVLIFILLTVYSHDVELEPSRLHSIEKNGTAIKRTVELDVPNDSDHSSSSKVSETFERQELQEKRESITSVEEEEAIVMENICTNVAGALKSTFRFTAVVIRRTGDTIAVVVSGALKAVAGALKLSADGVWITAMRLAQPRAPDDRMPHLFDHAGRRVAKVLRTMANVFYGFSEACIMTGETTEALAVGLGQAVEDSFSSLEFICSSLQRGLTFLLSTEMSSNYNSKVDLFHPQKRRAVLHTEAARSQRSKLPPQLTVSDLRSNKQVNLTHNKDTNIITSDKLEFITDSEELYGGDIDAESARLPPSPSPTPSWSFFADASNSRGDKEEGSTYKTFFAMYIRTVFRTIGRWERNLSVRPPSELLNYFDNTPSIIALVVHMCWSWITGPWTSPIGGWTVLTAPSSSSFWSHSIGHENMAIQSTGIGYQLLCGLLIVAFASSFQYRSVVRKLAVILCLIVAIWLSLMASDHVNRQKVAIRASVEAVDSLTRTRVDRAGISPPPPSTPSMPPSHDIFSAEHLFSTLKKHPSGISKVPKNNKGGGKGTGTGGMGGTGKGKDKFFDPPPIRNTAHTDPSSKENRGRGGTGDDSKSPLEFEESVWMNVIMGSLWNVERIGGLGPYISQTIQGLVNDELALVPPGIANIQLKRFTLGTQAPIVQAVKAHSRPASICIAAADQTRRGGAGYGPTRRGQGVGVGDPPISAESESGKGVSRRGGKKSGKVEAENDWDGSGLGSGGGKDWGQWEEWQLEWDRRHTKSPSSPPIHTPNNRTQRGWTQHVDGREGAISRRPGGGNGCERLVVDMEVSYVSRDMDIVLTLRSSDVRSVLPEATVTLSGFVLSGTLRLDAELTPDYPFVGNSTYTHPSYGTVDLRHAICPRCDLPPPPTPTEVLAETVMLVLHSAAQGATKIVEGAKNLMGEAKKVAGRILDVAEEVGSVSAIVRKVVRELVDELHDSLPIVVEGGE